MVQSECAGQSRRDRRRRTAVGRFADLCGNHTAGKQYSGVRARPGGFLTGASAPLQSNCGGCSALATRIVWRRRSPSRATRSEVLTFWPWEGTGPLLRVNWRAGGPPASRVASRGPLARIRALPRPCAGGNSPPPEALDREFADQEDSWTTSCPKLVRQRLRQ